jgi:hypothetical protein
VPGHNWADEIAEVQWQIDNLYKQRLGDDAEDAERARLRAERKRLQSLPVEPDTWQETATGLTYGDEWQDALNTGTPHKWLAKRDIRVVLGKDWARVTGPGFDSGRLPLRMP